MKANLVAKNLAPFSAGVSAKAFIDKAGYLLGQHTSGLVIGYNNRNIPPNKIPQSYQDLLNPEWKGQMGLTSSLTTGSPASSTPWEKRRDGFCQETRGAERPCPTRPFAVDAARGGGRVWKLEVDSHHYQISELAEKALPSIYPFPIPWWSKNRAEFGFPSALPPSAMLLALLVDFLFSREGQQILAGLLVLVARKDIAWDFGGSRSAGIHVLRRRSEVEIQRPRAPALDEIFRKAK